jgi:hypothetical protein
MSAKQNEGAAKDTDRRLDPRISTRIDAVVDDAQHGSLVFTASGFSRTGAFLRRREPGTPLPVVGSVIQLVFNWPLETKIPPVRVEAKVIRQTEDGVGVLFDIAA